MTDTATTPTASREADAAAAPSDGQTPSPESRPLTTLVLLRHAVTEQTGPLLTGRNPGVDLSEGGRKQAEALADRLANLPVTAVYASPLERTTQTASAVAERQALPVRELPGALEADYGEWTGGKLSDLAQTDLWKTVQRSPSRARFPGGESLAEMQARIVLQRIVVSPASVTAFQLSSHGAALVKCNDTGSLDELLPPPPEDKKEDGADG